MDTLTSIQSRVSCALLEEPGPTREQLQELIKAGLRAPDHGRLTPWRFLVVEGNARDHFGELLAQAALSKQPSLCADDLDTVRRKAKRAPMILIVIAHVQEHPKVPKVEQLLSAGAAATNIINAAFSLNIGAMWRTGGATYNPIVKQGLGLEADDEIVGFLYLGTPKVALKPVPDRDPDDFTEFWKQ